LVLLSLRSLVLLSLLLVALAGGLLALTRRLLVLLSLRGLVRLALGLLALPSLLAVLLALGLLTSLAPLDLGPPRRLSAWLSRWLSSVRRIAWWILSHTYLSWVLLSAGSTPAANGTEIR
jgi:hypothetical protein